jgi:spore maturation protein CgeB
MTVVQMRVLFLNTDYPGFLNWLYRNRPGLALCGYEAQLQARNASLFGTADFMSQAMNRLGHTAIDIHANNRPLQEAWAAENRRGQVGWLVRGASTLHPRLADRFIPWSPHAERAREILAAQIAAFRPTILYNHDPTGFSAAWLRSVLPRGCAMVAQIASPRGDATDWQAYDLAISSLPNFVSWFAANGVAAEYLPLAFEPRVLAAVPEGRSDIPLSFVGSVSPAHRERLSFLETIAANDDLGLALWGEKSTAIAADSKLHRCHRSEAWGPNMFSLLRRSQLTLNKHIDVSEGYANNMRLFEATGMGACLVTDWKENLAALFEPGKEVIAYRSTEECLDLLRYFSAHEAQRMAIAAAGHARCLAEHCYERRMNQLADILQRRFG